MKMHHQSNQAGRIRANKHPKWMTIQYVQELLLMTQNAMKITIASELFLQKNQSVHINDDH